MLLILLIGRLLKLTNSIDLHPKFEYTSDNRYRLLSGHFKDTSFKITPNGVIFTEFVVYSVNIISVNEFEYEATFKLFYNELQKIILYTVQKHILLIQGEE